MGLRLLADHCISKEIIDAIRQMGHDVVRLKDVLAPDSPDAVVIRKAKEIDAVLISLNGDFADIITYPPEAYGGNPHKQEIGEGRADSGCS